MLPIFVRSKPEDDWKVLVGLPAGVSLSHGEIVRISAEIDGVSKELARYEVPEIKSVHSIDSDSSDGAVPPPKEAEKEKPVEFQPSSAHICANPYLPKPPEQTDSLSVVLGCLPEDPAKDLSVRVDGKVQKVIAWSLTSTEPITYSAKLAAKLQAGQVVNVLQPGKQRDPDSPSQSVAVVESSGGDFFFDLGSATIFARACLARRKPLRILHWSGRAHALLGLHRAAYC